MPVISQLDGTNAVMYYRDHPPPHVHFRDANFYAKFEIETRLLVEVTGALHGKREKILRKWIARNEERLMALWSEAYVGRRIERL